MKYLKVEKYMTNVQYAKSNYNNTLGLKFTITN